MKLRPAIIDFIDRVGATFAAAALAVYIADPKSGTLAPALLAGGLSAGKFVYLKLQTWLIANGVNTGPDQPAVDAHPPVETTDSLPVTVDIGTGQ